MYIKARPGSGLGQETINREQVKRIRSLVIETQAIPLEAGRRLLPRCEGPNLGKSFVSFVSFNPFELTYIAMAPYLSPFTRTSAVTKPRHMVC